ncbi:GNAT family N-acetyltransferase [Enterovibrio norvegicus]|nr:GNAT family N-acetyltransferase [Enterovibrio norvegicus]
MLNFTINNKINNGVIQKLMTMECKVISTIEEFGKDAWNALLPSDYPFIQYEFFYSLEKSQAVSAKTGWFPQYIGVYRHQTLVGVAPCFIKAHPYGEYVFDWSWAEAYEDAGMEYYPKLVCAVPFTPSSGPRLLVSANEDSTEICQHLLSAMQTLAKQRKCSGVHVLFPTQALCDTLKESGFLERRDVQFHWLNRGYTCFDEFMAKLTSRKRRTIRKERQSIGDQGATVHVLEGEAITSAHWDVFTHFYQMTYLKRSGHTGYLNSEFFHHLGETMLDKVVLVFAEAYGDYVAGALYIKSNDTLFGRYWGSLSDFENLHFELCYYQGIEYCIEHGITTFDAGAQGEHKLIRGFEPVITYSGHYLAHQGFHDGIAEYLTREHDMIQQYYDDAFQHLPYRKA